MATMFRERIFYTWLILDLLTLRSEVHGEKAPCPLSIRPQRVVLEYGQSINVECRSSEESNANLSWKYLNSMSNESTLVINSEMFVGLVGWNGNASCHGRFVGLDDCKEDLNITIYKRPDRVSISTVGHTGPMIEGREYELQCDIENVAPVQLLTVNWYKGNNLVKNLSFVETTNPADETATLKISPSRNDVKTQYHCEAKLKPAPSDSAVKSDLLNIIVHHKPAITDKLPQWVPVFRDHPAVLVCEASGFPPPTIAWIVNNNRSEGGNLTVKENGVYICVANNSAGNDSRVVNVVMKEDYLPLIAGFVALVVVIISVFFISIYSIYYKNTKTGHYTVEGAKPSAQNGNIAQNGKDSTIPMKKIMV